MDVQDGQGASCLEATKDYVNRLAVGDTETELKPEFDIEEGGSHLVQEAG
jgi:hypothetical protein